VLTEDDMAGLPLPTTRSIEVLHFTPEDQIDPIFLHRSYFVEPESSGARAYVLLHDALKRSGKVAVVQVALRQREALAMLRSRGDLLVLETLLWPDEIRTPDFPFLDQDIDVRSQELKMAASLIESMTGEFDPAAHRDGYREALAEVVAAKTEGRDVLQPTGQAEDSGEPVSLMDALRASVAAAHEERDQAGQRRVSGAAPKEPTPGAEGAGRAPARRRSRRRASA
jgi:DNA end-binding protein Ku